MTARVAARVSEKRVLKRIRAILKAGVMGDGLVRPVDQETGAKEARFRRS